MFSLKALFDIENLRKVPKIRAWTVKNLANGSAQKSAKTNFTPFSHLSALPVSTSFKIFTAALCYLPCFIKKGLCFVVAPLTPRVSVCLQQLIIN
jgi:hypothetical protein